MGIIIRESFNQSAIRIGIAFLSAIAVIFIYPLDKGLYGLITYVINTAALLMPFILLGVTQASLKFFPYNIETRKKRKAFFRLLVSILVISIVGFVLLFIPFKKALLQLSKNPSENYEYYLGYIGVAAILFALIEFLVKYISNYKIVSLPVALQSAYKIFNPIVFLGIYLNVISIERGIQIIIASLLLSLIALSIITLNQLNKDLDIEEEIEESSFKKKDFYSFYFWAFASAAGSVLALRIDGIMIPTFTDFESNGEYSLAIFISTVVTIPISAVVGIAHPILSEAWKENNQAEIKKVYFKGSENLLFIGVAMLIANLLLLDLLPLFLPVWEAYEIVKNLVFILGVGRLFDMASGVNGVIIQYSPWFRMNTVYIIILVAVNVFLNYWLIQELGLIGAAIATAISLTLFNILKTELIYRRLKLQPITGKMVLFSLSFLLLALSIFQLKHYVGAALALTLNIALSLIFLMLWLYKYDIAQETKESIEKIVRNIVKKVRAD